MDQGDSPALEVQAERPTLEMSSGRRWAVTIGVMTGMAIAALEATVVGTAMPTVIASLGGINHYSWVFSAYLVTSTVTVPIWGKLSDLYDRPARPELGVRARACSVRHDRRVSSQARCCRHRT